MARTTLKTMRVYLAKFPTTVPKLYRTVTCSTELTASILNRTETVPNCHLQCTELTVSTFVHTEAVPKQLWRQNKLMKNVKNTTQPKFHFEILFLMNVLQNELH